jgi:hypothetical protein
MTTLHACTIAWCIALLAKVFAPSLPWLAVALAPLGWYALMLAAGGAVLGLALAIMGALLLVEYLIDGKVQP